jgi:hypothetical protein
MAATIAVMDILCYAVHFMFKSHFLKVKFNICVGWKEPRQTWRKLKSIKTTIIVIHNIMGLDILDL